MKKILIVFGWLAFLWLISPARAQVYNPQIAYVGSAPSGACNAHGIDLLTPNGTLYTCQSGMWAAVSGGGGALPAGSAGDCQFNGGGGAFSADTGNCTWDSVNHRWVLRNGPIDGQPGVSFLSVLDAGKRGTNTTPRIMEIAPDGFARIVVTQDGDSPNSYYIECLNFKCSSFVRTNFITTAGLTATAIDNGNLHIGTDGFARITYTDNYADLYLLRCTNAACTTGVNTQLVSGGNLYSNGFYLDTGNIPVLIYSDYNLTPNAVHFLRCANQDCIGTPTATATLGVSMTNVEAVDIIQSAAGFPIAQLRSYGQAGYVLFSSDANFTGSAMATISDANSNQGMMALASDGTLRIMGFAIPGGANNTTLVVCTALCASHTTTDLGDQSGYPVAFVIQTANNLISYIATRTDPGYVDLFQCLNLACTAKNLLGTITPVEDGSNALALVNNIPLAVTLSETAGAPAQVWTGGYAFGTDQSFFGGDQANTLKFSQFVSAKDGRFYYCLDCTVTSGSDNTCIGSGNGADAIRVNGAWKCWQ